MANNFFIIANKSELKVERASHNDNLLIPFPYKKQMSSLLSPYLLKCIHLKTSQNNTYNTIA